MKKEISVSDLEANAYASIVALIFIGILFGLHIYIWKEQNFVSELSSLISANFLLFLLIFLDDSE